MNRLQPDTGQLKLCWRLIETKEQERAREKLERDRKKAEAAGEKCEEPKAENPFKFNMPTSGDLNPENHLPIDFDYPLVSIDSSRLLLTRQLENNTVEDVPVPMVRDTGMLRRWHIRAPCVTGGQYTLTIPDSVFRDVAGYANDSIVGKYTVYDPEKFATVKVHVSSRNPGMKYIVQRPGGSGTLKPDRRDAPAGGIHFT